MGDISIKVNYRETAARIRVSESSSVVALLYKACQVFDIECIPHKLGLLIEPNEYYERGQWMDNDFDVSAYVIGSETNVRLQNKFRLVKVSIPGDRNRKLLYVPDPQPVGSYALSLLEIVRQRNTIPISYVRDHPDRYYLLNLKETLRGQYFCGFVSLGVAYSDDSGSEDHFLNHEGKNYAIFVKVNFKAGLVQKRRPRGMRLWQKRWLNVVPGKVCYNTGKDGKLCGTIMLGDIRSVHRPEDGSKIFHVEMEHRTFEFQVETAGESFLWVRALNRSRKLNEDSAEIWNEEPAQLEIEYSDIEEMDNTSLIFGKGDEIEDSDFEEKAGLSETPVGSEDEHLLQNDASTDNSSSTATTPEIKRLSERFSDGEVETMMKSIERKMTASSRGSLDLSEKSTEDLQELVHVFNVDKKYVKCHYTGNIGFRVLDVERSKKNTHCFTFPAVLTGKHCSQLIASFYHLDPSRISIYAIPQKKNNGGFFLKSSLQIGSYNFPNMIDVEILHINRSYRFVDVKGEEIIIELSRMMTIESLVQHGIASRKEELIHSSVQPSTFKLDEKKTLWEEGFMGDVALFIVEELSSDEDESKSFSLYARDFTDDHTFDNFSSEKFSRRPVYCKMDHTGLIFFNSKSIFQKESQSWCSIPFVAIDNLEYFSFKAGRDSVCGVRIRTPITEVSVTTNEDFTNFYEKIQRAIRARIWSDYKWTHMHGSLVKLLAENEMGDSDGQDDVNVNIGLFAGENSFNIKIKPSAHANDIIKEAMSLLSLPSGGEGFGVLTPPVEGRRYGEWLRKEDTVMGLFNRFALDSVRGILQLRLRRNTRSVDAELSSGIVSFNVNSSCSIFDVISAVVEKYGGECALDVSERIRELDSHFIPDQEVSLWDLGLAGDSLKLSIVSGEKEPVEISTSPVFLMNRYFYGLLERKYIAGFLETFVVPLNLNAPKPNFSRRYVELDGISINVYHSQNARPEAHSFRVPVINKVYRFGGMLSKQFGPGFVIECAEYGILGFFCTPSEGVRDVWLLTINEARKMYTAGYVDTIERVKTHWSPLQDENSGTGHDVEGVDDDEDIDFDFDIHFRGKSKQLTAHFTTTGEEILTQSSHMFGVTPLLFGLFVLPSLRFHNGIWLFPKDEVGTHGIQSGDLIELSFRYRTVLIDVKGEDLSEVNLAPLLSHGKLKFSENTEADATTEATFRYSILFDITTRLSDLIKILVTDTVPTSEIMEYDPNSDIQILNPEACFHAQGIEGMPIVIPLKTKIGKGPDHPRSFFVGTETYYKFLLGVPKITYEGVLFSHRENVLTTYRCSLKQNVMFFLDELNEKFIYKIDASLITSAQLLTDTPTIYGEITEIYEVLISTPMVGIIVGASTKEEANDWVKFINLAVYIYAPSSSSDWNLMKQKLHVDSKIYTIGRTINFTEERKEKLNRAMSISKYMGTDAASAGGSGRRPQNNSQLVMKVRFKDVTKLIRIDWGMECKEAMGKIFLRFNLMETKQYGMFVPPMEGYPTGRWIHPEGIIDSLGLGDGDLVEIRQKMRSVRILHASDGSESSVAIDDSMCTGDLIPAFLNYLGHENAFEYLNLTVDSKVDFLSPSLTLREQNYIGDCSVGLAYASLKSVGLEIGQSLGVMANVNGETNTYLLFVDLVFCEGWLHKKKTKGFKNWRKLFFRLKKDKIFYFGDPEDSEPIGVYPIQSVLSVEPYEDVKKEVLGRCFQIEMKSRNVILMAQKPEEQEHWINMLKKAMKFFYDNYSLWRASDGGAITEEIKELPFTPEILADIAKRKTVSMKSMRLDRRSISEGTGDTHSISLNVKFIERKQTLKLELNKFSLGKDVLAQILENFASIPEGHSYGIFCPSKHLHENGRWMMDIVPLVQYRLKNDDTIEIRNKMRGVQLLVSDGGSISHAIDDTLSVRDLIPFVLDFVGAGGTFSEPPMSAKILSPASSLRDQGYTGEASIGLVHLENEDPKRSKYEMFVKIFKLEGYLERLVSSSSWQKQYVIISGDRLLYHTSHDNLEKPLGHIPVIIIKNSRSVEKILPILKKDIQSCFQLTTLTGDAHVFKASNKEDADQWVGELTEWIKTYESNVDMRSHVFGLGKQSLSLVRRSTDMKHLSYWQSHLQVEFGYDSSLVAHIEKDIKIQWLKCAQNPSEYSSSIHVEVEKEIEGEKKREQEKIEQEKRKEQQRKQKELDSEWGMDFLDPLAEENDSPRASENNEVTEKDDKDEVLLDSSLNKAEESVDEELLKIEEMRQKRFEEELRRAEMERTKDYSLPGERGHQKQVSKQISDLVRILIETFNIPGESAIEDCSPDFNNTIWNAASNYSEIQELILNV